MADAAARIAQLEAQVRQFQDLHAAACAEIAALRAQVTEDDDSPADVPSGALSREAYERLYGVAIDEPRPDVPLDHARLLEDLEQRTRDLTEALEQQTATTRHRDSA